VAVTLREAQLDDRDQLHRLLADYLFEFDGRAEAYPYLDAYWVDPERLPFLVEVDGKVVGLCLVRRRDGGWSIAEFTVLAERRRGGVGRAAVDALAARARSDGAGTSKRRFIQTIKRRCRSGSRLGSVRSKDQARV
jgi:ribosomal protein S18 acetylase RimI-like enzyme